MRETTHNSHLKTSFLARPLCTEGAGGDNQSLSLFTGRCPLPPEKLTALYLTQVSEGCLELVSIGKTLLVHQELGSSEKEHSTAPPLSLSASWVEFTGQWHSSSPGQTHPVLRPVFEQTEGLEPLSLAECSTPHRAFGPWHSTGFAEFLFFLKFPPRRPPQIP